ncbi:hypothetical protein K1719_022808 [Acacia pycnantha]|nr:hypothetical protein K1719_022808 [Acacia pycnantha]
MNQLSRPPSTIKGWTNGKDCIDNKDFFYEIITNPGYVNEEGRLRILVYHDLNKAPHGCGLCPPNMCKKVLELEAELDEARQNQECYWWQRSRVACLRAGDRNSRYFHLSTVQRRQRNSILRIKGEDGVWIEDEEAVANSFAWYYEALFKPTDPRLFDDVLKCVDSCISEEMNAALVAPVTRREVNNVVFQLGGNKAPGPDGFNGKF